MAERKVWIELAEVDNLADAKVEVELVNKMLRKLGVPYDVFFATDQQRYCGTFYNKNEGDPAQGGGFTESEDRGAWFNLDFLTK